MLCFGPCGLLVDVDSFTVLLLKVLDGGLFGGDFSGHTTWLCCW